MTVDECSSSLTNHQVDNFVAHDEASQHLEFSALRVNDVRSMVMRELDAIVNKRVKLMYLCERLFAVGATASSYRELICLRVMARCLCAGLQ